MIIDPNFQTPFEIGLYMNSLIPEGVKTVLEPTPGLRQISSLLVCHGYDVTEPEDYFLLDKSLRFDAVVGNPPFSGKSADLTNAPPTLTAKGMAVGYHILTETMEMSDNLIMLMPWFTISDSDVRMRKLKEFGLISVTPLPRKTFNYARIQTVVLQMQKGYAGQTTFNTNFFFPKPKLKQEGYALLEL